MLLRKGDRIRLKVRTVGGWKGTATVTEDQTALAGPVWFRKDGSEPGDGLAGRCSACCHEVEAIRKAEQSYSEKKPKGRRKP